MTAVFLIHILDTIILTTVAYVVVPSLVTAHYFGTISGLSVFSALQCKEWTSVSLLLMIAVN